MKRILYIFTRTPLHVGAGASVGAIDQPIIRERHTGFPIIPATSLKGAFADAWNDRTGEGPMARTVDGSWLFGSTDANNASAGALMFSEARLLAFPIRSAKGSFAWITSPLLLQRAARDGVLSPERLTKLPEPLDRQAIFHTGTGARLDLNGRVVLEEYTFEAMNPAWLPLNALGTCLAQLIPGEPVLGEIADRIVILSNGMMSFFAQNACEVAQHVRINDETGTADGGALFNQENVPSETLFYSVLHSVPSRLKTSDHAAKSAKDAMDAFQRKIQATPVFQFGGDASTGLGYCTVQFDTSNA